MSLKNKIIVCLIAVFGGYGLIGYAIQRQVVLPSFVALERAAATDNTLRVIEALGRELDLLIPSATDWGTWDDPYQFMEDRNETFSTANLNDTSVESLKANFLALYDTEGRQVWGLGYDIEAGEPLDLGESVKNSAEGVPAFLGDPGSDATVAGIFPTAAGPLLVASRPILPSSGEGLPRGRVVVGRLLNEAFLHRIEKQARVRLTATLPPPGESAVTGEVKTLGNVAHTAIELKETAQVTQGHTRILDMTGAPIRHFQVDTPRTISARGVDTVHYAALYFAGGGLMVLLLLLLLLRRSVFQPMSRLVGHVTEIGAQNDLSVRLNMTRKDEIGVFARAFDRMVSKLAEARERLMERSYHTGVAEMACGVLHNIGNAVTPLGVKVTAIKQDLQRAPVAEVEMAAAELSDPATLEERRVDLTKFIELAGEELAGVVKRTAAEVDAIQTQLDHVQMILTDQQRFSKTERIVEPLLPGRVVDETVRLLPEEALRYMRVEIDPAVHRVGRVRASRIALQQVMSNLLINAVEAIRETGQKADTGRLRIHAAEEDRDGQGCVHLRFEDNGTGIPQERIPHLFERGFSTKSRGSGLGLHWSANTIMAMGGRLWAESAGPGLGACMHLLLHLSTPATKPQEIET